MTSAVHPPSRTVTLHSPSGETLLAVPAWPAAVAVVAAVALAPRLTALVALGALARRLTLSVERPPGAGPAA